MPDLVAIASPGRQRWIIIRSSASCSSLGGALARAGILALPTPTLERKEGFSAAWKGYYKHVGPQAPPGPTRAAVRVGCPGQAEVNSELLFSMQMVWCMLWGEWAQTRLPRPKFGYMNPGGTAGFHYPPCPHPATGLLPSCTGTRSMSWVRAWGRRRRGSKCRSTYPHRLAGIRLSLRWQDKSSFE